MPCLFTQAMAGQHTPLDNNLSLPIGVLDQFRHKGRLNRAQYVALQAACRVANRVQVPFTIKINDYQLAVLDLSDEGCSRGAYRHLHRTKSTDRWFCDCPFNCMHLAIVPAILDPSIKLRASAPAEQEWEVEKVLQTALRDGERVYQVKWVHWAGMTWEPLNNLQDADGTLCRALQVILQLFSIAGFSRFASKPHRG